MRDTQIQFTLAEPGRFEAVSAPVPAADEAAGEALIRIRHIGVCGTDIHAFHGRQPFFEYPRILGHELGAEVISAPAGSSLAPGDLVAVEPYLNDPTSAASRRGKTNCCEQLKVLGVHCDGGMRPVIAVPAGKLHVSRLLDTERLALVEMLCIGQHAVERAQIEPDEFALVIGAGPIGMSVLQFLKTRTARVAVADVSESRLAFCRERLGIDHTLLVRRDNRVASELRELSGAGELPTAIFDATGNAESMMETFDLAAHGGRIVFVGRQGPACADPRSVPRAPHRRKQVPPENYPCRHDAAHGGKAIGRGVDNFFRPLSQPCSLNEDLSYPRDTRGLLGGGHMQGRRIRLLACLSGRGKAAGGPPRRRPGAVLGRGRPRTVQLPLSELE